MSGLSASMKMMALHVVVDQYCKHKPARFSANAPSSEVSNVRLRIRQSGLGRRSVIGVENGRADLLGEVGSVGDEGLLDGAADGRVPAVVAERGQEGLIDCATFELGS